MREIELLNALKQADGGVQVNLTRKGVTVSTRYTPLVKGKGDTLFDAALECARKVAKAVEEHPLWRKDCADVLKALDEYDQHSRFMQAYG
jgi:hypothetical protein